MKPDASALTIAIPGTCGELVQGWSDDWDEAVLVSCPIDLYSYITVELCPAPHIFSPNHTTDYTKLRQAVRLILDYLNRPDLGAVIRPSSQLDRGRGMASSTADIVGVTVGLALALGHSISPGELAQLACRIEPSDSTMFAYLTRLAYRGSARYQELGPVPALPLLMLDTGEAVDTLTYNARLNLAGVRQLAPTTRAALDLLQQGLARQEAELIGAAASLSALSYQAINHNPLIDQAARWAADTGGLGVVRAHSGSVVGLLYPAGTELAELEGWLAKRFAGSIRPTRLTRGSYLPAENQPFTPVREATAVL